MMSTDSAVLKTGASPADIVVSADFLFANYKEESFPEGTVESAA